jgi:peptide deformylase
MAVKPILTHPLSREKLKKKANKVEFFNDELIAWAGDLTDTVQSVPGAAGLAAVQIGLPHRIIVVNYHNPLVLVNPKVVTRKNVKLVLEGCLSVQGYAGKVPRPNSITIEAQSLDGKILTKSFKGMDAQTVDHEIDHLDGILFVDRLTSSQHLYRYDKEIPACDPEFLIPNECLERCPNLDYNCMVPFRDGFYWYCKVKNGPTVRKKLPQNLVRNTCFNKEAFSRCSLEYQVINTETKSDIHIF